ncbi:MAG: branched-chain amino acid aminotransferase [Rhizobiales bacterium]|nr:branched-chain amino acid aminotransferase [Hyphomicrobiales bacterium]NRB14062.1 branched-chain amino acid aminotransferase [Hyphomicrobiales bacterium]
MSLSSFENKPGYIWLNGQFIPWADNYEHLLSHALHYGSSVFEGDRAYNGKIFELEQHTSRLFESARILDIKIPYSEDEINQACIDTLKKQGFTDAYIRPYVWRGVGSSLTIAPRDAKINVLIAMWEWPSYYNEEELMQGIKLCFAEYKRPAPDTAPYKAKAAGLYVICTISKHKAEAKGYSDALMLDYQGNVAEATSANIFFVKNGELHTPKADSFLNGITRRTIMKLAEQHGIKVVERQIKPSELDDFDECFLTGTAAEVTPVSVIENHTYKPAQVTLKLMQAYYELVGKS